MNIGSLFASIGRGVGKAGKSAAGLFDSIDPPGTPGGMAREAGTGGALPAGAPSRMVIDPANRIGMRSQLDPMIEAPVDAPQSGGWWSRMKTPDASGYSTIDRVGELGATMQDQMRGSDRAGAYEDRAGGRLKLGMAEAAKAKLAAQVQALYPNDPRMRFALMANPEKAAEFIMSQRTPVKAGLEDRLLDPTTGAQIAGPVETYSDQGGFSMGRLSGEYGARRPENYTEGLARRRLDEVDIPGVGIDRFEADTGRMNAGTSAYSARTGRMGEERLAAAARAAMPGAGGAALGAASTDQLLAWLKGAR